MRLLFVFALLAVCGMGSTRGDAALRVSAEDFGLFDQTGDFHQLSYFHEDPQTKAIVVFTHGVGCPLVRKRYGDLASLAEQYGSQGVRFWMLNANEQDSRSDLVTESQDYEVSLPILKDDTQEVARFLGVDRTGEAIVIETGRWNVVYRGGIDDRLSYEKEKSKPTKEYLKDALDGFLSGNGIEVSETDAPGCRISFAAWKEHKSRPISYADEIAPLIKQKCVGCHEKGGIAPFALSSFKKVRGWSEMIREVLMTRRMPPWQSDPVHGEFDQDLSLTSEQRQTLLHWIEQGTPRGDGEDLLSRHVPTGDGWKLGTPDHEIEIPEQSVPANGVIDYRHVRIDFPFDEDTWIAGAEVRPGDRKALHHLIVYIVPKNGEGERYRHWLIGYAPGIDSKPFPENTGILGKKDEQLLIELHYTSYGKETIDRTKVALYRAGNTPEHELRTGLFIDDSFKIPAHDRRFEWSQTIDLEDNIVLHSLTPHMHLRGKSMRFDLRTPDGEVETLLSVPYYNFNWQHTYTLAQPRRIPNGSQLTLHASWDNSDRNPANPNPKRVVTWGEQSFDEMFFGTYRYVHTNDEAPLNVGFDPGGVE